MTLSKNELWEALQKPEPDCWNCTRDGKNFDCTDCLDDVPNWQTLYYKYNGVKHDPR